jgi:transcription initiation factor TFIIH subunit 4
MDTVDVLSFLFMLGSLELGQDYSTVSLTATQKQMLIDLEDFGIVYTHAHDPTRFYPTRLSTTLTSDAGALLVSNSTDPTENSSGKEGYIILETNHRLYAYTKSPLQTKILSLFTKFHIRFPNLVSGILTKKSINEAIKLGITSDQIIAYITTHAHPQMLKNTPVLPPTVVDQIRLWQLEENRMTSTKGYLMKDFNNQRQYLETVRYAEEIGVCVWRDDENMRFFVNAVDQLRSFLKGK